MVQFPEMRMGATGCGKEISAAQMWELCPVPGIPLLLAQRAFGSLLCCLEDADDLLAFCGVRSVRESADCALTTYHLISNIDTQGERVLRMDAFEVGPP